MRKFKLVLTLVILAQIGCMSTSGPASPSPTADFPTATETAGPSDTPSPEPTPTSSATSAPTATFTASPEPSPTPTEALLDLEIVEWAEYEYATQADPASTDTRVELLVRNPNDMPVRIDHEQKALEFINAAGETVFTNTSPFFYIREGAWIEGGAIFAVSACVCFWNMGLEPQAWENLRLVVAIEPALDIAFTTDVEVTLSEWIPLSESHLGGDTLAALITLINTSDLVLVSFEVLVIARDEDGVYVGVAIWGSFNERDGSGGYVEIQPDDEASGIIPTNIDYYDGPLVYEITAVGVLAAP